MRLHLPLSLAAALLAPCSWAQEKQERTEQYVQAVLLVQFGPGDLVLNAPLLDAMASEPACRNELERVLSGPLIQTRSIRTGLPAPHLAGTFQIHIEAVLDVRNPLSTTQQDAAIDAIVGHLKRRLDQVLYDQPMQNLTKRRDELDSRHRELQGQRAQLQARADAATALQQHSTALEQQLLSARIDVATETRGRELIEKMIAESTARRDDTRDKIAHHNAQLAARSVELGVLQGRLAPRASATRQEETAEEKSARTALATVQAEIQASRNAIDMLEEMAKDGQRMLAVLLEQLPNSALATQRATARVQSLLEEKKSLEELQANVPSARSAEASAERLQIDIAVIGTMLTEIQGKLTRLQPVQYELVRQR